MFYWQIYKALNPDLVFEKPEDYIKHFMDKGRFEGRRYNIEQFSPYFRTFIYRHNNIDLKNLSEIELKVHWIEKGFYEGRISDRLIKPIFKINPNPINTNIFEKIDRVIYINLDIRPDRRLHIENEIQWANIPINKIVRLNAIKNEIGYIGCTLSHIACLEYAIKENLENILILEDDFTFKKNNEYIVNSINKIEEIIDWNVILLSANLRNFSKKKENIYKVSNGKTTAGYIVNKNYFRILCERFKESLNNLIETNDYSKFAIDVYWKELQERDNWYTFFPTLGYQKQDYSDIEKRIVNYGDII